LAARTLRATNIGAEDMKFNERLAEDDARKVAIIFSTVIIVLAAIFILYLLGVFSKG
jgi:hypothetical protein